MWLLGVQLALFAPIQASAQSVGNGDGVLNLGATGYASITDTLLKGFNSRTNFSVEAALIIRANQVGGQWSFLLGKMYSPPYSDPGFALAMGDDQVPTVGQSIRATVSDGTQQISMDSRNYQGTVHAIMTWDVGAKVLNLYVNGVLEASATNSLVTANMQNTYDLKLGGGGASDYQQTLQRDMLFARLWNRVLSSNEVASVWNNFNTSGQHGLPANFDKTSLVSEWLLYDLNDATHLKDTQNSNHLQLRGTATLCQGFGVLTPQFPAAGATGVSKSAVLKAAGGLGTLGGSPVRPLQYSFDVDETSAFNSAAFKTSGWLAGSGTWKPILKSSTSYYWRVRVKDSSASPSPSGFVSTNSFVTKPAATWYARPGVYASFDPSTGVPIPTAGVYGTQDGTSYNNAWNGIFSIKWGEGAVEPGDTVYICGTHLYTVRNENYSDNQALNYISESGYSDDFPITIRMDAPQEPGLVWGAAFNLVGGGATWSGPDANGVYKSSNLQGDATYCLNGTNIVLLELATSTTWTGHNGAVFATNGVWYVKTPDGGSPAGKVLSSRLGYRFNLGRSSCIRFLNCQLRDIPALVDAANWDPSVDTQSALPYSSHITFDGCNLRYGCELTLTPGHDHWTVRNSELSYGRWGIYTFLNKRDTGASYLTVQSNYIHDMGTVWFPDQDAHGVGVQGGDGHFIDHNRIEDTGSAIEFWTYTQPMRNHTISYNFIKNIHVMPVTSGSGVVVSGDDPPSSVLGLRTGFKIYGNIIMNTGLGGADSYQGAGVSSNCKDFVDIYNNVMYNCASGMRLTVDVTPVQARVVNNIIVNPQYNYMVIFGLGNPTNLLIDNNLYYPAVNMNTKFVINSDSPNNQHSVYADPRFITNAPAVALDFQLSGSSKAIKNGLVVGLAYDFAGNLVPTNSPDIGALQSLPSPLPRFILK